MADAVTKEIVSVAEMARMCSLSRSRFYSIIKEGIMPEPSRKPDTGRPFYTREQQEQCLLVRRTNCGLNGKRILFYAKAAHRQSAIMTKTSRRSRRRPEQTKVRNRTDFVIEELQHGLEQLGLTDIAETKIRAALSDAYPDGHEDVATATLLMTVFRGLKRQDSPDNVAG